MVELRILSQYVESIQSHLRQNFCSPFRSEGFQRCWWNIRMLLATFVSFAKETTSDPRLNMEFRANWEKKTKSEKWSRGHLRADTHTHRRNAPTTHTYTYTHYTTGTRRGAHMTTVMFRTAENDGEQGDYAFSAKNTPWGIHFTANSEKFRYDGVEKWLPFGGPLLRCACVSGRKS